MKYTVYYEINGVLRNRRELIIWASTRLIRVHTLQICTQRGLHCAKASKLFFIKIVNISKSPLLKGRAC